MIITLELNKGMYKMLKKIRFLKKKLIRIKMEIKMLVKKLKQNDFLFIFFQLNQIKHKI